jgi:polyisoprenyl-phosphate glycosyltransferase
VGRSSLASVELSGVPSGELRMAQTETAEFSSTPSDGTSDSAKTASRGLNSLDSRSTVAYSVVIPVFNEEESIPELSRRVNEVMRKLSGGHEVVFVDDGSTDASFEVLGALRRQFPSIKVVRLSRNFGHHIALTAGIDYARGSTVIFMDADLQDQPEEIPKLLARYREGFDVVYGIRKTRKDAFAKRAVSSLFAAAAGRMMGSSHTMTGGIFRVVNRQVVDELKRCRETSRLVIGLIDWLGFKQAGVEVEHGTRYAGHTKYSLFKLITLGLNAVTSFSYVPLQLATYVGSFAAMLSLVAGAYIVFRKLVFGIPVAGYASLIVAVLFLGSIQLIVLGIIGEYIGRVYTEVQSRPLYVVKAYLD